MSSEPKIGGREPVLVELVAGETYWWCRCGRSQSQPFCDGFARGHRHRAAGMEGRARPARLAVYLQAHQVPAHLRRQSFEAVRHFSRCFLFASPCGRVRGHDRCRNPMMSRALGHTLIARRGNRPNVSLGLRCAPIPPTLSASSGGTFAIDSRRPTRISVARSGSDAIRSDPTLYRRFRLSIQPALSLRLMVGTCGEDRGRPERTKVLEANGYRVLRFWNNDVPRNIDGVLEEIQGAITTTPPLALPTRGGEKEK